jgi:hypothetical protein
LFVHLVLAIATTGRPLSVVRLSLAFCILINSSKTTGPIWTKLWWNGPWVVPFQNCVRQPRLPFKMAVITKNRKFGKNHLKTIFSKTTGPIGPKLWWNDLQMVIFEKCVRRPRPPTKIAAVTKNRKFGKKSLKNYLLWNNWANWAQTMVEWSLGGHLSELCLTTPAANQDRHCY